MKLSIVIPCFNEADNLAGLESELLPVAERLTEDGPVELLFVDDGSADATWEGLQELVKRPAAPGISLRAVRHEQNRGLGAAIRTGLTASEGDVVVTTDSDATYRFSEIPGLLSCLTPDIDLVSASPYHPRGAVKDVPTYRLVLSRGSSLLYRVLVSRQIHTYTALFRAYRRSVVEHVPFKSDGYLAGTELLVNAVLMGFRVAEYPAVLHARVFGVSKAKLVRTIAAHLRFQGTVLLHRLRVLELPAMPATLRAEREARPGVS